MPKPTLVESHLAQVPSRDRIGDLTRAEFDAALRDAIEMVERVPFRPSTNIYEMKPVQILASLTTTR